MPNAITNKTCENDARTTDAEMMENGANMKSKRYPTSEKICTKDIQQTMLNYVTDTGHTSDPRWGMGGGVTQILPNRQYSTLKVTSRQ